MREFIVKVNGRSYQVEVEEITAKESLPQISAEPKTTASAKPVAASSPSAKPQGGVAGSVRAPLPGTILNISVGVGDKVQRGDLLLLLEAMKMQNEIVSPADGIVEAIYVTSGQQVERDAVLIIVK